MNTSTNKIQWQIRFVFFVMASALTFAWTTNMAHADTRPAAQVSIASSGQVIVKGAVVTAVSGDTITARAAWGSVSLVWTVRTDGSTRFSPDATSANALKAIRIGDTLAFSGDMDTSAYSPTVLAHAVKDTDLERESVTAIGTLLSVDTNGNNFTIATRTGTTTVSINAGTIMTLDGDLASLADLQSGVEVQIIGSLNTTTNTMLAQRVSWKTPSKSITDARVGIISGFFTWLMGTHGALSMSGF